MKRLIAKIFGLELDYRIVGEYYDSDGNGRYRKKYIKKYYFKRRRK